MKKVFSKFKGAKLAVMVTALSLIMCTVIGGTVSWLVDKTGPVTNTFTYGDINIKLTETTGSNYKMIPGSTLDKDPTVTVKAGSEACWLFVKIDKSANFDDFMTYSVANGWTQLTKDKDNADITDLVYYREVGATTAATDFSVLENDCVVVKDDVTKQDFNSLQTYPTLTFTAYAVQHENILTPALAWDATK